MEQTLHKRKVSAILRQTVWKEILKMKQTRGIINKIPILLLLITIVYCQRPTLVIDNFTINSPAIVIVISTTTNFPVVSASYIDTTGGSSTNIIGGERDLQLTVSTGEINQVFSTSVSSSEFEFSSPSGSTSYALLQYDGIDGSMDLNTTGLQSIPDNSPPGINFLQNNGSFFNMTFNSDAPLEGYIYVYDIISGVCFYKVEFLYTGNNFQTTLIDFNSFEGVCDFSVVGAVEFFFNAIGNDDFLLMELSIVPPVEPASSTTLIIDDFTVNQSPIKLTTSSTTVYPVSSASFQPDVTLSHILGGERDMEIVLTSSVAGMLADASVYSKAFEYSFPSKSKGYAVLQYDGDDGSMNVNVTGLTSLPGASFGLNLQNNNGKAFNITYYGDGPLSVTILVYDINGNECKNTNNLVATIGRGAILFIVFDEFTGNCNFQKVGAIEVDFVPSVILDFSLFSFSVTSYTPVG